MKFLRYACYPAIFIASVFLGLLIFAPWKEAGLYAFDRLRLEASRKGYYVTCDSMEQVGFFRPSYRMSGLDVEGPMARASLSDVAVSFFPASSIFSRGARIRTEFNDALVMYIPNNKLSLINGEANLSASRNTISISDAIIEGDVKMTGGLVFDVQNRTITESTAVFSVPPLIGAMLGTPVLSRFVEPAGQGEWRIRENAHQRQ